MALTRRRRSSDVASQRSDNSERGAGSRRSRLAPFGGGKTLPRLLARYREIREPAAIRDARTMAHRYRLGRPARSIRRRIRDCGDVVLKVAGFAEVVFVDPDVGAGQQAIEGGFEAVVKTVDPVAIRPRGRS